MLFGCFRSKMGQNHVIQPETTLLHSKQIRFPAFKEGRAGHLYVIKEREFLKTNESIFKIGKTINIVKRMPQYPKQSRVYIMFYSTNIDDMEKHLIAEFDKRFIKRTDIGSEYYECNQTELLKDVTLFMLHIFSNFKNIHEE